MYPYLIMPSTVGQCPVRQTVELVQGNWEECHWFVWLPREEERSPSGGEANS